MQVDRARNCFLDLHGKFSLSLSEILKKVVRPHSTKQYEEAAQEFETQLNVLGAQGWEFIQRADGFFFLKRDMGQ